MTEAEQFLWNKLRKKQLEGLKFRRQHPFGHFILDFYCHEKKLVVELDGGYHESAEQKKKDMERTFFLTEVGLTEIRFKNKDVIYNIELVLDEIRKYLRQRFVLGAGAPSSSPKMGEDV